MRAFCYESFGRSYTSWQSVARAGIALLCCAAREAQKIGCRDREYGLHARDGRQDKQAGQDKEKREGEGKRRGVETMEGRKAELEGLSFFVF